MFPKQELIPELPPSWVPKLSIPRDAFDMRCPRGSKLCLYHKAQHEIFALFGDCSRWDGMVEKLVLFEVGGGREQAQASRQLRGVIHGKEARGWAHWLAPCMHVPYAEAIRAATDAKTSLLNSPHTHPQDEERQVQAEVRETFQRRKDKLRERRTFPQKVRVYVDCVDRMSCTHQRASHQRGSRKSCSPLT